ncbi:unnamed protein product [Diamesa hyperborea]
MISRYIPPEYTQRFALICHKTATVVASEAYYSHIHNVYCRDSWEDKWQPNPSIRGVIRDATIRELYKRYPKFQIKKEGLPDDYDRGNNKICLSISHELDEKTNIRSYYFQLQSKFTNWRRLAKLNPDEGKQILLVKTKHFHPVPNNEDIRIVKSIQKLLSLGFINYRLKIIFCDRFGKSTAGEPLIFDPIVSVNLYDWWDPKFSEIQNNHS